jgi:hypothetical protein
VTAPNGDQYSNTLFGIDVLSATDAWAVGESGPLPTEPLILRWNGTAWTRTNIELQGTLRGVAAIAPNDVWAVGWTTGAPAVGLVMHYDGTAWSQMPSPGGQFLYAVAGAASDDVWAVGKEGYYGVAFHWDGTEWTQVPVPQLLNTNLYALEVISSDDVWAVGVEAGQNRTLTIHWDGTAWTHIPSPNPGTRNVLRDVSAVGPNDVWAVGWWASGALDEEWLGLHWDGESWSFEPIDGPTESPLSRGKLLYGVSAVSPTEVWAVGQYYDEWYADINTAVLRWDGTTWTRVPSQDPSDLSLLYDIDMLGPSTGWAAGSFGVDSYHPNSMIQRYGPPCVSPTPAPPTATPGGATNTPRPPTSTPCVPGFPIVYNNAITDEDEQQWSRINDTDPPSNCVLQTPCSVADLSAPRYYDSYTLTNPSGSSVCVTVELHAPNCSGFNTIQSVAYFGSYNPNALCQNYVADIGETPYSFAKSYSFNVPANGTFVVVVNTIEEGFTCSGYRLSVSGLPNPGCVPPPTLTATGTRTATNTRLPTRTATATPGGPTSTPGGATSTAIAASSTAMPATSTAVVSTSTAVVSTSTSVPSTATSTATATPLSGECTIQFSDVEEGSTFHMYVRCLACRNVMGGYADSTFRPGAQLTRGQLSKIVANAAGMNGTPTGQTFEDVPATDSFYLFIERLAGSGVIGGYACGGPGEPCGEGNRPYFRPGAGATRGQISKIVANAAQLTEGAATVQMFEDVAESSPFYMYVQALASRGVMGGYSCGGDGEPCGPTNMPYFRPSNQVTRGQIAKVVANTFFPNCQTP